MKVEQNEREVILSAVDKVISMYDKVISQYEEANFSEEKKLAMRDTKEGYCELYTLILQNQELNQKNIILLISAIDSVITLMMKERAAISEAIKMLDERMAQIIEDNFQDYKETNKNEKLLS